MIRNQNNPFEYGLSNGSPQSRVCFGGIYLICIAIAFASVSIALHSLEGKHIAFSMEKFIATVKNLHAIKVCMFVLIGCICLVLSKKIEHYCALKVRLIVSVIGFYLLTFYLLALGDFIVQPSAFVAIAMLLLHGGVSLILAGKFTRQPTDSSPDTPLL